MRSQLQETLSRMDDWELLERWKAGTLTDDAKRIYEEEISRRGLLVAEEGVVKAPSANEQSGSKVNESGFANTHPWRRFFAKWIDSLVIGLLPYLAVLAIGERILDLAGVSFGYSSRAVFLLLSYLYIVLFLLVWSLTEAFCLAHFGATPGRAALGICIRASNGEFLSFNKSIIRALGVFIQGMGLGVPVVNIVAMAVAYRILTKTGKTSWDRSLGVEVEHATWTWKNAVFAFVVVLGASIVLVVINGIYLADSARPTVERRF